MSGMLIASLVHEENVCFTQIDTGYKFPAEVVKIGDNNGGDVSVFAYGIPILPGDKITWEISPPKDLYKISFTHARWFDTITLTDMKGVVLGTLKGSGDINISTREKTETKFIVSFVPGCELESNRFHSHDIFHITYYCYNSI